MLRNRNFHQMDERKLKEKIKKEYALFKFEMLSGCRREIYENCNKIWFYEVLYEYFLYKETIDERFIAAGLQTDAFMDRLYQLYLKYEELHADSWQGIEELLEKFLSCRLDEGTKEDGQGMIQKNVG